MSNPSLNNWYNTFYFRGQGFNTTVTYNETHPDPSIVCNYYEHFLVPLAVLISKSAKSFKAVKKKVFPIIKDGTQTYDVKCGDTQQWEALVQQLLQDASMSINDLITYMSTLGVGNAWMYVLDEFATMYSHSATQEIKENILSEWNRYIANRTIHTAWFGFDKNKNAADDVYVICKKNTIQTCGILEQPVYVYTDPNVIQGSHIVASMLKLKFYDYDKNRLELAKDLVKQSPNMLQYLPHTEVECIVNNKLDVKDVYITDVGEGNVPPLSVLHLNTTLPSSERKVFGSMAGAVNYHVSLGAHVDNEVLDWLRTPEVIKFLNLHTGIPDSSVTEVKTEDTPHITIQAETEKIKVDIPTKKSTESEIKEVVKIVKDNTYKKKYEELEKEYNKLKEKYDALSLENAQNNLTIQSKDDEIQELKLSLTKEQKSHIPEETTLIDKDRYYVILKWYVINMRLAILEDMSQERKTDLVGIYTLVERLIAINPTDNPTQLLHHVKGYRSPVNSDIANKVLDDMERRITDIIVNDYHYVDVKNDD